MSGGDEGCGGDGDDEERSRALIGVVASDLLIIANFSWLLICMM